MPRTRPPYPAEFRAQMVQLARESEASAQSLRDWVKQAELDKGIRTDGLTAQERDDLARLRGENRNDGV